MLYRELCLSLAFPSKSTRATFSQFELHSFALLQLVQQWLPLLDSGKEHCLFLLILSLLAGRSIVQSEQVEHFAVLYLDQFPLAVVVEVEVLD